MKGVFLNENSLFIGLVSAVHQAILYLSLVSARLTGGLFISVITLSTQLTVQYHSLFNNQRIITA